MTDYIVPGLLVLICALALGKKENNGVYIAGDTLIEKFDQLDEKLGRLLWMSSYLLEKEIPHGICCQTGEGMKHFQVSAEPQIWEAVDALLACPKFAGGEAVFPRALWRYHIGGDGHEV